jgi:hypothetical protein
VSYPRKISIGQGQCAGDVLVLTAAIKALHQSQPGAFLTDYIGNHGRLSNGNNLFENNPYITPMEKYECERFDADYGYGVCNSGRSYHFLHAFVEFLEHKLGVQIELKDFRGDLYLSEEEKQPWPGLPERYAVIDAGVKGDFTAKGWSTHRYQEVVNATKDKIAWVQIGSAADSHPNLENVVSLVGHTNLRQLIRVFYRSALVLTPVSLPMHLAAAVPMPGDDVQPAPTPINDMHRIAAQAALGRCDGRGKRFEAPACPARQIRPCVVLMGQREQRSYEAYNGHTVLGTNGKLSCGVRNGEACWRNKTIKIDGDQNLCTKPLQDEVGQWVPECLHRVTTRHVVEAIEAYL